MFDNKLIHIFFATNKIKLNDTFQSVYSCLIHKVLLSELKVNEKLKLV